MTFAVVQITVPINLLRRTRKFYQKYVLDLLTKHTYMFFVLGLQSQAQQCQKKHMLYSFTRNAGQTQLPSCESLCNPDYCFILSIVSAAQYLSSIFRFSLELKKYYQYYNANNAAFNVYIITYNKLSIQRKRIVSLEPHSMLCDYMFHKIPLRMDNINP